MQQLIMVFHVLACISIVILVLIQHGKGADMGAAFGSGASATLFGSKGSNSFLLKLTGGLALIFFATSLGLGYISTQNMKHANLLNMPVIDQEMQQEQPTVPGLPSTDTEPTQKSEYPQ